MLYVAPLAAKLLSYVGELGLIVYIPSFIGRLARSRCGLICINMLLFYQLKL